MQIREEADHLVVEDFDGKVHRFPRVLPDVPRDEASAHPAFRHARGDDWNVENMLASSWSRDVFIRDFGFAMLTRETLDALAEWLGGKLVLEVGAGSGYLAQALCKRGARVEASDLGAPARGFNILRVLQRDHEGDSLTLLPGHYDVVLMSWPHDSFGFEVAKRLTPGQYLVYQGEASGGCTADADFFELLDSPSWEPQREVSRSLNRGHLQFFGMHDTWSVFRRV